MTNQNPQTPEELAFAVELENERRAALTPEELAAEDAALAAAGQPVVAKRPKKLQKDLSEAGKVKITVLDGEKGEMVFDVSTLPAEIQTNLVPFGLGHKLGDAAAGRTGKDAEEAITKVFEGLVKGDWTVRAPAAQKVSLSDIAANLKNLGPEEQAAARALLAQMGIKIPEASVV